MKWISVVVLVIIGALAAFVAVEYLTVSIHHLPSYIPGYHAHRRGHYHKRGAIAAVIAVVALGIAGYLAYRFTRTDSVAVDTGTPPSGDTSADQLLSAPAPAAPASPDATPPAAPPAATPPAAPPAATPPASVDE
jgi:hypothetical protein